VVSHRYTGARPHKAVSSAYASDKRQKRERERERERESAREIERIPGNSSRNVSFWMRRGRLVLRLRFSSTGHREKRGWLVEKWKGILSGARRGILM